MFKKKKTEKLSYDRENMKPIIRASICNGEQVAGFKDIHTGKFSEVMLIRGEKDFRDFLDSYDLEMAQVGKEY